MLLQNVLQIVGIKPAGQQILYGLIILLMLFVYGRNARVQDWPAHLDKLCAFWSSVMLMTGRYKGTPMKVHAELPEIAPEHFQRWLALFQSTAQEICPGAAASLFTDRSQRIAQSLQLGIALHRGETPIPGSSRRTEAIP